MTRVVASTSAGEFTVVFTARDNVLSKFRPRVDMLWIITYRHRMPSFLNHISRYVRYKPVTHQKRSTIAQNQPREIDEKYTIGDHQSAQASGRRAEASPGHLTA